MLALTATATASVKEDVVQALGLVNCIVFRQSFNRPNLRQVSTHVKLFFNITGIALLSCYSKLKIICLNVTGTLSYQRPKSVWMTLTSSLKITIVKNVE